MRRSHNVEKYDPVSHTAKTIPDFCCQHFTTSVLLFVKPRRNTLARRILFSDAVDNFTSPLHLERETHLWQRHLTKTSPYFCLKYTSTSVIFVKPLVEMPELFMDYFVMLGTVLRSRCKLNGRNTKGKPHSTKAVPHFCFRHTSTSVLLFIKPRTYVWVFHSLKIVC